MSDDKLLDDKSGTALGNTEDLQDQVTQGTLAGNTPKGQAREFLQEQLTQGGLDRFQVMALAPSPSRSSSLGRKGEQHASTGSTR